MRTSIALIATVYTLSNIREGIAPPVSIFVVIAVIFALAFMQDLTDLMRKLSD